MNRDCPECSSEDTILAGGEMVCRSCQTHWDPTVSDLLTEDDVAGVFERVGLQSPTTTLSGVRHPALTSLQQGIAELSVRQRVNRDVKVAAAITLIEEIERVIAGNLLRDWDWDGKLGPSWSFEAGEVSGQRAVAALDRMLVRANRFESMWKRAGRRNESLERTPWEDAGKDLAWDLERLASDREFFQAARTLLAEPVSAS